MLSKDEIDLVIFHRKCPDGFGSALAAWKYYKENHPDKKLRFHAANHGEKPPDDIKGLNVLICDFSYKYPVLKNMLGEVNRLLIIDHHETIERELEKIPKENKIFDMTHSGAYLTWKYFFDGDVPELIQYIEDRDIWKNKKDMYKEFTVWWQTVPFEFEEYEKYLNTELLMNMIKTKGAGMLTLQEYNITNISKYACPKLMQIGDDYYMIAYINTNTLKSDIGNFLIRERYPLVDFSAMYNVDDWSGRTYFSLRSSDQHVSVSKIAEKFGGGGHRNASGISLSMPSITLPGRVINVGELYNKLSSVYDGILKLNNKTINYVTINTGFDSNAVNKFLLRKKYTKCDTVLDHEETAKLRAEYLLFYEEETDKIVTKNVYTDVSVVSSILSNLNEDESYLYKKYSISVCWYFNGRSIEYVLYWKDLTEEQEKALLDFAEKNGKVAAFNTSYLKFTTKATRHTISLF